MLLMNHLSNETIYDRKKDIKYIIIIKNFVRLFIESATMNISDNL